MVVNNSTLSVKKNFKFEIPFRENSKEDALYKQSSNPSIDTSLSRSRYVTGNNNKNERIPRMSKGSRRLMGYGLLIPERRLNKSNLDLTSVNSKKNKFNKNFEYTDTEFDDEAYDLVYDSKVDAENSKIQQPTLSRTNSDSHSSNTSASQPNSSPNAHSNSSSSNQNTTNLTE